jgi:hypothetical protein
MIYSHHCGEKTNGDAAVEPVSGLRKRGSWDCGSRVEHSGSFKSLIHPNPKDSMTRPISSGAEVRQRLALGSSRSLWRVLKREASML